MNRWKEKVDMVMKAKCRYDESFHIRTRHFMEPLAMVVDVRQESRRVQQYVLVSGALAKDSTA